MPAPARPTSAALAAIDDFETTVSLGEITKNFAPVATNLKAIIEDPANTLADAPRDFAKLDHAGWVQVITANGGRGAARHRWRDAAGAVANYAATLAAQAERLFPTVAFVAEVGRSAQIAARPRCRDPGSWSMPSPISTSAPRNIDAYAATNNLNARR